LFEKLLSMCRSRTVVVSETTHWWSVVMIVSVVWSSHSPPLVAHGLVSVSVPSTAAAAAAGGGGILSVVETRTDPFGGTGLYATAAIAQGHDVYHCSGLDEIVYCSLDDNDTSPIATCVKSFCIGKNAFTESVSIGASLASWKLFQDCGGLFQQKQQQQQQTAWEQQAGILQATANHAANLPWEKAKWQLPVVWPPHVLQSALAYGYNQVVMEQQQQEEESTSLSLVQLQTFQQELQEVCDAAKNRVANFQLAAVRLAEELEPILNANYCHDNTIMAVDSTLLFSSEQVHMACHQAMAMIFSRSFLHPQTGEMTMLPIIDSANHNATPNCDLKNHVATRGVKLVANQDIQIGDEITITYNLEAMSEDKDKAISFAGYGFVPLGMAQQSPAGRVLHLAAIKGQEMARELLLLQQQEQQQQQSSASS
jgi:SET domain